MSTNKVDNLSKEELIQKLQRISTLCDNVLKIKEAIDDFEPEDNYERKVEVPAFPFEVKNEYDKKVLDVLENDLIHDADDAIETMSSCYDKAYLPVQPNEPKPIKQPEKDTSRVAEYKKKMGCMPVVAGFLGVCSLISGGLFSGEAITVIFNLILIAICVVAFIFFFIKKAGLEKKDEEATKISIQEYEHAKKEQYEKHQKDMEEYQNNFNSYNLQKADFLGKYAKWREVFLEHLKEEDEIEEQLENDRQAAVDKIREEKLLPAVSELEETNDILSKDYLGAIDVIIDLLKCGRADNLKEAINVYEEIVYRERQLQLQKEQEEQRRYEEELRRQDEERRYQEEKQFREHQEWERKREVEERERAEERRHREEMAQREKQERERQYEESRLRQEQQRRDERAELERKRQEDVATTHQCNTCALCGKCSMAFRRPNCASYRPR